MVQKSCTISFSSLYNPIYDALQCRVSMTTNHNSVIVTLHCMKSCRKKRTRWSDSYGIPYTVQIFPYLFLVNGKHCVLDLISSQFPIVFVQMTSPDWLKMTILTQCRPFTVEKLMINLITLQIK